MDKGALEATTFYALQSFRENPEVQQAGCRVLRALLERTGAAAALRLRAINADELLWMAFVMHHRASPEVVEQAGEALSLTLASETKLESAVSAGAPAAIVAAGRRWPRDSGVQQAIAKVARLIASSQVAKTAGSVAGAATTIFMQVLNFPTEWEVLESACRALAAMAQSKAGATRGAVEALMGDDEGAPVQKVAGVCRAWLSSPRLLARTNAIRLAQRTPASSLLPRFRPSAKLETELACPVFFTTCSPRPGGCAAPDQGAADVPRPERAHGVHRKHLRPAGAVRERPRPL